ncbi:hypothetical protein CkaCkLH20_08841 [Colletotrichum karsti]|uniref:RRM domain-containing protein n=1 Tax=Colletotrichum karsti TaxID=1095194 RepID=A0A9P6I2G1_9PEZI|nr:uncharacterized protein CkaCkLH20_08841 [Colletotrichum karsti]KAF9873731.1 hypothetical protein CkaCkLH20_08841 [Colletotrichum karsti]
MSSNSKQTPSRPQDMLNQDEGPDSVKSWSPSGVRVRNQNHKNPHSNEPAVTTFEPLNVRANNPALGPRTRTVSTASAFTDSSGSVGNFGPSFNASAQAAWDRALSTHAAHAWDRGNSSHSTETVKPSSLMDKYPQLRHSNNLAQNIAAVRGPRQPGYIDNGAPFDNFGCGAPAIGGHANHLGQSQGVHGIMAHGLSTTTARPIINPGGRVPVRVSIHADRPAPTMRALGNASSIENLNVQMSGISIAPPRNQPRQALRPLRDTELNTRAGIAPLNQGYRAMEVVGRPCRLDPSKDPQRELKAEYGISLNYGGDASIARNQSANIPDNENCSMWITNLPADCTHNMLLSQIQGFGRIYCCVINPPDPHAGHTTAAAKVVFFELKAAQCFYSMCSNPSRRLMVGGRVAKVSLNRIKSAEQDTGGHKSRALKIAGDIRYVNPQCLTSWFQDKFVFDIDEIIEVLSTEDMGVVEYRFGSWRCQAEAARMALFRDFDIGQPGCPVWEVTYADDPCA